VFNDMNRQDQASSLRGIFLGEPGSFPGEPEMRRWYQHLLPIQAGLLGYMARRATDGAVVSHGLCRNLNELIKSTWLNDHDGLNCYCNFATFICEQGVLGKDGKIHFRSQENAGVCRSFRFDIDCRISKPKAAYANQEEAITAVEAMCRSEGLPSPVYVDSGGGLHGYWSVERDLTQAEWLPYAHAIAAATRAHGIAADHQCTINFVGVLRPIGTHHVKTGKLVKLIGELVGPFPLRAFDHLGEKYRNATTQSAPRGEPAATSVGACGPGRGNVSAAILSNLYDPSNPAKVAKACRQIAALAADPSAFSEPMHRLTAGVLKHCKDGERFYLDLLDSEWRDAGQAKLDRWTAGPTTCRRFDEINPGGCAGCPHRNEIKSPIQLGTQAYGNRRTAKWWRPFRRRRKYAGAGRRF